MNAYRRAPHKVARRRFEFRARGSVLPLVIAIVISGVLAFFYMQRVSIECARTTNRCVFNGITVPLTSIIALDVEHAADGTRLAFRTASNRLPVTNAYDNVFDHDRQRIAGEFDTYLASRTDAFKASYGPNWLVAIGIVVTLGIAGLNVFRGGPTALIVYDAAEDIATITSRERAFGSPQTTELRAPRVRVWKRMIELYDDNGASVALPAREDDPQARGLSTVLARE